MKKSNYFWFFIFLNFFLVNSCSDLLDLGDPGKKDDPLSLFSFASLQDLANQALITGTVPQYSTFGNKSGLITVGDASGCVVMSYGKLKCWGQNDNAQLGDGSTSNNANPHLATSVNPSSISDIIVAVVSGRTSTCAYYYTGFKCWGNQTNGVLGNGVTTSYATTPQIVTNATGVVIKAIQLNDGYSCMMSSSGVITCWGLNTSGQLGNGTTVSSTTGVNVSLGGTASTFVSHNNDGCAILTSNLLKCWGQDFGSTPVTITTSGTPQYLGGGTLYSPFFTCVVLTNSTVQCFGNNGNPNGEFGNGTTGSSSSTTAVTVLNNTTGQPLSGVNMVGTGDSGTANGHGFACAVVDDFTSVYCWGSNRFGNFGNGTTTNSTKAIKVNKTWPNSNIIDIAVSDGRACILLKNNDVWCWGGGYYNIGELGNGNISGNSNVAIKILNRTDP
jgi:hypothetical protein